MLITGGAGGVGHYAIQFAKARGATVLTTVSSEAKAKLARQAGADHTIDYKRENVGERVDGADRQDRRRCGDRDGSRRQRQALSRHGCARAAMSWSMAPAAPRPPFRRSPCWSMPSRSNSSMSTS